jgi:hypothetical protein
MKYLTLSARACELWLSPSVRQMRMVSGIDIYNKIDDPILRDPF